MVYAAASVWLSLIVLAAWGVQHHLRSFIKPRTLDNLLLPGTLVARVAEVIGLLLTGAVIDQSGPPPGPGADDAPPQYKPKIPIVGPMIVALLSMAAVGGGLILIAMRLGKPVVAAIPGDSLSHSLPTTAAAFWDQMRGLVTLAQHTLDAMWAGEGKRAKRAAFIYLLTCLAIRMAPRSGSPAGHVGAILGLAGIAALAGTLSPIPIHLVQHLWPSTVLVLGWLLLLTLVSLTVRGLMATYRAMARLM